MVNPQEQMTHGQRLALEVVQRMQEAQDRRNEAARLAGEQTVDAAVADQQPAPQRLATEGFNPNYTGLYE